jgi:hypothetical protein
MPTSVFPPNQDWWAKKGNLSVQLWKIFNLPTLPDLQSACSSACAIALVYVWDGIKLVRDMTQAEPPGRFLLLEQKNEESDPQKHEPKQRTEESGRIKLMIHPGYIEGNRIIIVKRLQRWRNDLEAMPTSVFSPNRDWWAKNG